MLGLRRRPQGKVCRAMATALGGTRHHASCAASLLNANRLSPRKPCRPARRLRCQPGRGLWCQAVLAPQAQRLERGVLGERLGDGADPLVVDHIAVELQHLQGGVGLRRKSLGGFVCQRVCGVSWCGEGN